MSGIPGLLSNDGADPASPVVSAVQPLASFRTVMEDGTVVQSQAPLGYQPTKPRIYHSSFPHLSMHRKDGVKIAFVHNTAEVTDAISQQYLDEEIAGGNPFLRHANPDEAEQFRQRRDPRGYMTEKVRAELLPQMRKEVTNELIPLLREQIRQELEAQQRAQSGQRSQAELDSGVYGSDRKVPVAEGSAERRNESELSDQQRLEGIDRIQQMRDKLKAGTGVTKEGPVTIVDTTSTEKPLMGSNPAPLQGIVSSNQIKDLAAGSTGNSAGATPSI